MIGVKRANSELDYQVLFGRNRVIILSPTWSDFFLGPDIR